MSAESAAERFAAIGAEFDAQLAEAQAMVKALPSVEEITLRAAREAWERDAQAVAEYEYWQLQTLIAEQDAEGIAEK